jgi:hypothetical protein
MSGTDPDRSPPPVDGEVGEALRPTAGRTPGASGYEDQLARIQSAFLAVHLYEPGARYAHEDDVDLLVDVLSDPPPSAKAHQVGVEILARAQGPDYPFTSRFNRLCHQVGPDNMGQVTRPGATHFLPG